MATEQTKTDLYKLNEKIKALEAENAKLKITGNNDVGTQIGDAIKSALKSKDLPPMQPTKTMADKLIECDEVIVEKSEKGKNIVIVETIRKGVKISPKTMDMMNRAILTQERCKAYLPKGKKAQELLLNN